jgi:hypothetical protein
MSQCLLIRMRRVEEVSAYNLDSATSLVRRTAYS